MKYDYTPKTLDDIVFPSDHARETVDQIVNLRIPLAQSGKHGILIYGTNGTGKSTLANMIPREIERRVEGDQYLWITQEEVGSTQESHRIMARVDSVTSRMRWPGNTYQYIILDEVDRLGPSHMDGLKVYMNRSHSLFIMTTNHLERIDRGVIDRSHLIEFNEAAAEKWLPLFGRICRDNNVSVPSDEKALAIIKQCRGSARGVITAAFDYIDKYSR